MSIKSNVPPQLINTTCLIYEKKDVLTIDNSIKYLGSITQIHTHIDHIY